MQTLNHAPDYFVLCGEAYLDMREILTQAIVDGSAEHFKQHLEVRVHTIHVTGILHVSAGLLPWESMVGQAAGC